MIENEGWWAQDQSRVCSHAPHPDDGFPVRAICLMCLVPLHLRVYGKVHISAERPIRAEVRDAMVFAMAKDSNGHPVPLTNRKVRKDRFLAGFVRQSPNFKAGVERKAMFPFRQMMANAEAARSHASNKHEAIKIGYIRTFKRPVVVPMPLTANRLPDFVALAKAKEAAA